MCGRYEWKQKEHRLSDDMKKFYSNRISAYKSEITTYPLVGENWIKNMVKPSPLSNYHSIQKKFTVDKSLFLPLMTSPLKLLLKFFFIEALVLE